jgi:antitoxin VapB
MAGGLRNHKKRRPAAAELSTASPSGIAGPAQPDRELSRGNWHSKRTGGGRGAVPKFAQAIQATGETMTRAVTEALRERYERLRRRDPERLAADIRAIAAHIKRPYLDPAEHRYDEHGLPK